MTTSRQEQRRAHRAGQPPRLGDLGWGVWLRGAQELPFWGVPDSLVFGGVESHVGRAVLPTHPPTVSCWVVVAGSPADPERKLPRRGAAPRANLGFSSKFTLYSWGYSA